MSPIEEYLADQDFSPKTKSGYSRDITAFFNFSGGQEPTVQLVRAWQRDLEKKGRGENHISRCMYALKGYCEWMGLEIFAAPREKNKSKVRAPAMRFRDPPPVRSVDDVDRMFKACRNPRDKMILMLFIGINGPRIGELMKINVVEDIDFENKLIALTRKGKRGRKQWIAVSDAVMDSIRDYLEFRDSKSKLLLPFTYPELRRAFRQLAKRAGVTFPPNSLFHNMRHFYAHFQKLAGTDIRAISAAMGHSSTSITERIYGVLTPDELKQQLQPMPWEHNIRQMPLNLEENNKGGH